MGTSISRSSLPPVTTTTTSPITKPVATPPAPLMPAKRSDDFDSSQGRASALPLPPVAQAQPSADSAKLAAEAMRLKSQANAGVTNPLPGFTIDRSGGNVTITGTKQNDRISIEPRKDGKPGVDVITAKGRLSLNDDEAKKLTIDGGAGNDTIVVDPRVKYDLTLRGGSGDDLIRAGGGNDTISGGEGRDFLYGNGGKDTIRGGAGNDTISGGEGDDVISGDSGKNTILGGAGKNTYANGGGADRVFHNSGDKFGSLKGTTPTTATQKVEVGSASAKPAGHTIKIDGSPEFVAKVEAELENLRSTKTGRAMLEDIDAHPDKPIRIKEGTGNIQLQGVNTAKADTEADSMPVGTTVQGVKGTGKGTGSEVHFSPDVYRTDNRLDGLPTSADETDPTTVSPTITLFHELVHAHRSQLGESHGLTTGEEFATAGTMKNDAPHNHEAEWKYTENKLRAELGMPERFNY